MCSSLWISEPVGDRRRELLRVVTEQVNRKAKQLVTAAVELDVLVLNDQISFTDSDRLPLVRGLATMRMSRRLQIPQRTMLLVHSEANFLNFRSFLIDGGGRLFHRSKGRD
jgi:hypothetical protein